MTRLLVSTIDPNPDTFDLMLIIAVILFAIAAAVSAKNRSITATLGYTAAAFVTFAWTFTS